MTECFGNSLFHTEIEWLLFEDQFA